MGDQRKSIQLCMCVMVRAYLGSLQHSHAFSGVLKLHMFSCCLPHLLSLTVVEPHGSLEASESSRVVTYRMRVVQQLDSLGGMKNSETKK